MTRPRPHVTILLCTYNGAAHLESQLQSYLDQTHDNWSLWVSDDGSTDGTIEMLCAFRERHGRQRDIRLLKGPCKGRAALNFMQLLCHAELPPGYVALSDQDDVWLPFKLERALAHLEGRPGAQLYAARTRNVDAEGRDIGGSRRPRALPVFETAMMQNFMPGNTMVLNPPGLALVRAAGVPRTVAYHDWWLTLLFTASGGRVTFDMEPVLLYRQHRGNILGAAGGWRAGTRRARKVFSRSYGDWVRANVLCLRDAPPVLPAYRAVLSGFLSVPSRRGPLRVWRLARLGLYRQSRLETVFVYLMVFLGRV